MAISTDQAQHFVSRVKTDYLGVMVHVQAVQAAGLMNEQEVAAWGGASAITAAVDDTTWEQSYPFTKQEFADILANFAALADVMGSHGDLKTNLTKLRE